MGITDDVASNADNEAKKLKEKKLRELKEQLEKSKQLGEQDDTLMKSM
jgi:hypothetical protein